MSTAETAAQIINSEMPDVPPSTPSKINLKDYKKPSFDVETVDLDIKLFAEHAQVSSTLKMVRQTAGELVLFGEDLELLTISMNGNALTSDHYKQEAGKLIIADAPDAVTLDIEVRICPQTNTALEGLYMAGSCRLGCFALHFFCSPFGLCLDALNLGVQLTSCFRITSFGCSFQALDPCHLFIIRLVAICTLGVFRVW